MRRFVTRESKKDFYILYTLVFGIISFFIYYQFAGNGKSLVWSHDGIPQHLNSLAYYGRYLRKALYTIFVEHKLSLPMWDMNIGYGSDILTTLHYYVIGDPLTLLSVFVPADKTEILYEVLIFLRIYLAGISFSIFCFYHKNPKQATFMGTLIYIFAGWTIYAAMKHPYFSNPMIYLPLVLMGIDKIYKKEKPWLFIWAVAISAMSNFYFFYMICIFMFIYAAFRYFGIFSKRSVKDVFIWLLKFIGYYAVALMIAAAIFLPVIMTLFGTDRFQAENYVPLLYDKIYYEKYLGNLIGENMIQWGVAGYSAVAMAGVFVLFSKKKKYLDLKWGFALLNLFFVIVLKMDVAGVALATIISQTISAILTVMALMKRTDACRFELKAMAFHKDALVKIIKIGVPAGIQGSLFSISNVLIQSAINSFGSTVVAGNSAASNLEGFIYTGMNAFAQAAVTFTSQNVGARRYDNLDRVMRNCLLCAAVTGLVLGGGASLLGEQLLHFYSSDEAVVAAGLARMHIICTTYLLCGCMDVLASCLRGRGYSVLPMVVSLVGSCLLRLVWIATIFQLFRSTTTLYLSYPISWILTALVHLGCLLVVRHKMKQEISLTKAA